MTVDCSMHDHSTLTFYLGSAGPDAVGTLELQVDGVVNRTFDTFHWANGFLKQTIEVGEGPHIYVFTARATKDGPSPFVVDTIVCDDE